MHRSESIIPQQSTINLLPKWPALRTSSGLLTILLQRRNILDMQTQTPRSDYDQTKGLIYFARMLDKIRLKAAGKLPPGYFVGLDPDPTVFDARCTRFLGVNYDELVERTLQGGTDEEILEWCFDRGRRPNEEEIEIWNAFILKRGWRDAGSEDLQATKKEMGCADRDDIQTWVDLHDVDEGRVPRK
jgi:hypothetical protein